MNKTLLIDTMSVNSPGMVHLKKEIISSIVKKNSNKYKIVVLQNEDRQHITEQYGLTVKNLKKLKFSFLGKWYWYNFKLPALIKKTKADVLFSMSGIISKVISKRIQTIITINNMVPFLDTLRRSHSFFNSTRIRNELLKNQYLKSCFFADSIFLHSNFAVNSISRFIPDIRNKTGYKFSGIPGGIDTRNLVDRKSINDGRPYFFYLTTIYWYKNHINLIRAYKSVLDRGYDLPELILAGFPEEKKYLAEILKEIDVLKINKKVRYIGILDKNEISSWFHYADINFFPSTCETNSVVLSEILGVHGVLASSNVEPMPEIVGDAAEYFDPFNINSIADVIISLFQDKEKQNLLRKRAMKRIESFSWENCAEHIWSEVDKLLGKGN